MSDEEDESAGDAYDDDDEDASLLSESVYDEEGVTSAPQRHSMAGDDDLIDFDKPDNFAIPTHDPFSASHAPPLDLQPPRHENAGSVVSLPSTVAHISPIDLMYATHVMGNEVEPPQTENFAAARELLKQERERRRKKVEELQQLQHSINHTLHAVDGEIEEGGDFIQEDGAIGNGVDGDNAGFFDAASAAVEGPYIGGDNGEFELDLGSVGPVAATADMTAAPVDVDNDAHSLTGGGGRVSSQVSVSSGHRRRSKTSPPRHRRSVSPAYSVQSAFEDELDQQMAALLPTAIPDHAPSSPRRHHRRSSNASSIRSHGGSSPSVASNASRRSAASRQSPRHNGGDNGGNRDFGQQESDRRHHESRHSHDDRRGRHRHNRNRRSDDDDDADFYMSRQELVKREREMHMRERQVIEEAWRSHYLTRLEEIRASGGFVNPSITAQSPMYLIRAEVQSHEHIANMRQQVDEDVANWIEYATWLDLVNEQFLDNYLNIPGYAAKIEKVLSSKKARQLFERRYRLQVSAPVSTDPTMDLVKMIATATAKLHCQNTMREMIAIREEEKKAKQEAVRTSIENAAYMPDPATALQQRGSYSQLDTIAAATNRRIGSSGDYTSLSAPPQSASTTLVKKIPFQTMPDIV